MTGRRQQSGLCLCIPVLLVGLLPPGVRHTHADGERPHSHRMTSLFSPAMSPHDARPTLAAGLGHRHADHGSGFRAQFPPPHSPTSTHVHFDCLFFTVTLPDPTNEPSPRDLERHCELIVLHQAAVMPPLPAAGDWGTPVTAPSEVPVSVDVKQPASTLVNLRAPRPLCDAARHERSGVQLA